MKYKINEYNEVNSFYTLYKKLTFTNFHNCKKIRYQGLQHLTSLKLHT